MSDPALEQAKRELLERSREDPSCSPEAFIAGEPPEIRDALTSFWRQVRWSRELLTCIQAQLAPGQELGGYRLEKELGSGASSVVWEATDAALRRRVALKVLRPHVLFLTEYGRERFEREARAGARLVHPGIVRIYAHDEARGLRFIVQELVPSGRSLADRIAEERGSRARPADFLAVARFFRDTARAVAHAHAAGIVHRDLKPSNLLLAPDGSPRVADFGLALLEGDTRLTDGEVGRGTPSYMSPEQIDPAFGPVGPAADIFSLAATMYEALTLERPFQGASATIVMQRILHADAPDARGLIPSTPEDLAAVCRMGMMKEPSRRYSSIEELASDLDRFLAGDAVRARGRIRFERWRGVFRRHRTRVVAAVLIGICVLAWVRVERSQVRATQSETLLLGLLAKLQGTYYVPSPEMLLEAADLIEEDLDGQRVDANVALLIGHGLDVMGLHQRALGMLDLALTRYQQQFGVESVEHALASLRWATVRSSLPKPEQSLPVAASAVAVLERRLGDEDLRLVEGLTLMASLHVQLGRFEPATVLCKRIFSNLEAAGAEETPAWAEAALLWTGILMNHADYAAAQEYSTLAVRVLRNGRDPIALLRGLRLASAAAYRSGERSSAESLAREAATLASEKVGKTSPILFNHRMWLAGLLWDAGRYADAEAEFRGILAGFGEEKTPQTSSALNSLGVCVRDQQRPREALVILEQALEHERASGASVLHNIRINMAKCHLALEEWPAASRLAQAALERCLAREPVLAADVAECQVVLALAEAHGGRIEPALTRLQAQSETLAVPSLREGAREKERLADIEEALGEILDLAARSLEARAAFQRSLDLRVECHGPEHPRIERVKSRLAAPAAAPGVGGGD